MGFDVYISYVSPFYMTVKKSRSVIVVESFQLTQKQ